MRLRKGSVVLVCALVALLSVAVASAAAAKSKKPKKPVATKVAKKPTPKGKTTKPKAMCQLGENTQKAPCTPNPLFSKDVCSDYLSQAQALAPSGTRIATAGNRYGPYFNTVGCYYTANGTPQKFYFTIGGGKNFHTNSLVDKSKQLDLHQAFEEAYQQSVKDSANAPLYNPCQPPAPGTVETTVAGYEAFTVDQCAPVDNSVRQPTSAMLEVLAGNAWIIVGGGGTGFGPVTSSQLIPFAKELIAKYH